MQCFAVFAELRAHFEPFGVVSSVRLAFDQVTGRPRGFGFVQFKLVSSAQQALLVGRQHNIAGQQVTVQSARAASRSYTPCSTNSKPRPSPDTNNSGRGHIQIRPYAVQAANPRHRQSQQRHVTSIPASPSLLDICHEVPTLPELLNMDDQKALSAVSRSLRRSFVAKIQVVTVTTREDLTLVNQSWPLLSMISLQTRHDCFVFPPPARSLACVGVSAKVPVLVSTLAWSCTSPITHMRESKVHEKIFMLTPLHTSAPLALASPATQQLARHLMAECPKLTSLSLNRLELPAAGVAVIAQLFKGDCSSLLHLNLLNLSQCGLATQDCLVLSQGNRPALRTLDLTHNRIDAEGMALLAKGKWPHLWTLHLSRNPALDAGAMSHLSAAQWPLQCLELSHMSHMPINPALTAELAQLHLSILTSVTLTRAGHIAAAVSELARAGWPVLTVLHLGYNALDAVAMQHLCRIHMPELQTLTLEEAAITAEGAYWLAQGSWPCLQLLDLSYNQLDAKAVRHIVSGAWPQLQSLSLIDTLLDDDDNSGLQQLPKGNWPLLDSLDISLKMLRRHDSAALLGLDTGHVQQLKSHCSVGAFWAAFDLGYRVARADHDEHLWPMLKDVQVCCMPALKTMLKAKQ